MGSDSRTIPGDSRDDESERGDSRDAERERGDTSGRCSTSELSNAHVLVAVDPREVSEGVLERAMDLAEVLDGAVTVLSVVDDRAHFALQDARREDVVGDIRDECRRLSASMAERVRTRDLEASQAVRRGHPAEEILTAVEETGATVVVVGAPSETFSDRLLGSVATRVIAESPVPVVTVPREV